MKITKDYLSNTNKKLNKCYPVRQTNNFIFDPRLNEFKDVLGHAAWNILDSQGYDMSYFNISINELWFQEHHQKSGHDTHIHGSGGQLCGFYFLENEKNSIKSLIHDPRYVKIYASLPQKNESDVTFASNTVNFEPEPGVFMLMNTWVPHSFTRNSSSKPFKFIHFNISVSPRVASNASQAEVI